MSESVTDLEQTICRSIMSAYSDTGWETITLSYIEVGNVSEAVSECTVATGTPQYQPIPSEALEALLALKKALATEAHGTWLSLKLKIDRLQGDYKFSYNYDEKPKWDLEPMPENYWLELQEYPRPASEIPPWFPKRVDQ
ncbi:hypothetical protein PV761_10060 [Arthrobacter sp. CC3]|uniref:hypothetical protein n=1 Tax=Arthrobacter sp. CC3 TaxID=3029185 RepID=UPI003267571A